MSEHPPGLVGVIAQETARFSTFAASLTALEVPPGTGVKWIFGHEIAANTNLLVRELLARPEAEWLWLLGDDHTFSPDLLTRLLATMYAHDDDILVPLCLMRNAPYAPVIFSGFVEDWVPEEGRERVDLDLHPFGGAIPIHSAGSGGMLIRRHVFELLAEPWFARPPGVETGEDLYFCDKAREAGLTLMCDLDAPIGHCTTAVVWPVRGEKGWTYGFSFMGGVQVTMPRAVRVR